MILHLADERAQSWNTYYAGAHWTKRKREAERVHLLVKVAVIQFVELYGAGARAFFTEPVEICVIARYKTKPVDVDNVMVKLYIDGLRNAGVILDDDPAHVAALHVASEKYTRNEVVIKIIGA